MTEATTTDNVTCLGCGCACDDISVVVRSRRIVEARNACSLGLHWFGDGDVPSVCRVDSLETTVDQAVAAGVDRLLSAARPLVFLAPGLSNEAQREAIALADLLRARLDTISSTTAGWSIVASQEQGFASATLGEIRNRADVVVYWAIDLASRYPRFIERYAPEPAGTRMMHGSRSRRVIAVDVGDASATVETDHRIRIEPPTELAVLGALEAMVRGETDPGTRFDAAQAGAVVTALARTLLDGRYIAVVYDAEPDPRAPRSELRFTALASLGQSLNDRVRCATIAMRAGGNRSGADANLVAQTGYPFGIDFARGAPRYDPWNGSAVVLCDDREVDTALVIGDATELPDHVSRALGQIPRVVIGPRASRAPLGSDAVAIDTAVDGIHTSGTASRADDVPLPLRATLASHRGVTDVLRAVGSALAARARDSRAPVGATP